MSRLFVAIPLPDDVLAQLVRLRPRPVSGLRLVRSDQLHVTLHFIGDGDVAPTCDALQAVSATAFQMTLAGVGKFPPHGKPTVLWAGVQVSPELRQLHTAVGTALNAIGFTPESRPYAPHITLARCGHKVPSDVVNEFLEEHHAFSHPPIAVSEFRLYSSTTTDEGPIYHCERAYQLPVVHAARVQP